MHARPTQRHSLRWSRLTNNNCSKIAEDSSQIRESDTFYQTLHRPLMEPQNCGTDLTRLWFGTWSLKQHPEVTTPTESDLATPMSMPVRAQYIIQDSTAAYKTPPCLMHISSEATERSDRCLPEWWLLGRPRTCPCLLDHFPADNNHSKDKNTA